MKQNVVILLAEDNPGHAKLTKKHLKRVGICNTIYHFQNGEELLDLLNENNLSNPYFEAGQKYIIIMDLKMPKMDGLKALKHRKIDEGFSVISVIMFSTIDAFIEIFQCYKNGCNEYIVKPATSLNFSNFISSLVSYFKIIQNKKNKRYK